MNIDEVIKILRNEQTCVKTADSCDRDCAKCPLVIGSDEIIEAYEIAIKLLLQLTRTDEVRTQISAADCISRQAEIDALEERLRANGYGNVALVSELNRSIGYIMQLPSVQPERKTGKWEEIAVISDAYDICGTKTWASRMRCNECGFITTAIEGHIAQYEYCPQCGCCMM